MVIYFDCYTRTFYDGKENFASHKVYLKYPEDYYDQFKFDGCGYGSTLEEAFEDFKKKYDAAMANVNALTKMLFETEALWPPVKVDCLGKEIKE